jgi:hypothetical protein
MGAVVCRSLRAFDRTDDMAGQGTPGCHYRGARHGGLCDSRPAKHLRGARTAPARHEADPLFDPYRDLPDPSDVPNRYRRQRKERRHGRTLKLALTHFAA